MKFIFNSSLHYFLPHAWAVDVQMGSGGNLVFDPEVTISAGESVHFVNNISTTQCNCGRSSRIGSRASKQCY